MSTFYVFLLMRLLFSFLRNWKGVCKITVILRKTLHRIKFSFVCLLRYCTNSVVGPLGKGDTTDTQYTVYKT